MAEHPQDRTGLPAQLEELTLRLREAEQTLEAIRGGEVDALVVETPQGEQQLYTLQGADHVYRIFLESIAEGALTLSGDGTVLYANPAAAEMFPGGRGDSVTGTSLRAWLTREYRRSFDGLMEAGRQGLVSTDVRLRGKAGGRPAHLSIRPCVDLGETVMVAVLTDLTEQRKTEKLVEEERLARSILEQAGEAIIVCDRRGVVIRASRSVRELTGLDPLFRRVDDTLRLRTDDGAAWRPPRMEESAAGRVRQLPVWLDRADGTAARLLLNLDPLETEEDGSARPSRRC
jgi:PAS domain S-box-containing protein